MTQPKFKVKKGDTVKVMIGIDKGVIGTVEKVLLDEARVVVSGVNVHIRHAKPSHTNPKGSYEVTHPIHISNVAVVNADGNHSKVGYREEDGKKVRYFKKTSALV